MTTTSEQVFWWLCPECGITGKNPNQVIAAIQLQEHMQGMHRQEILIDVALAALTDYAPVAASTHELERTHLPTENEPEDGA